VKNDPIRSVDQIAEKIITEKLASDHLERISNKFWSTNYSGPLEKEFFGAELAHVRLILTLRDKLLTFGGEQAIMPDTESDIERINNRGQFWYGDRTKMILGKPIDCHSNSSLIFEKNRNKPDVDVRLVTGYALSKRMWRQHSWLVSINSEENVIIETTTKRDAYFGYVMTKEEANRFAISNIH
jgi:hypothetical protein